MDCNVFALERAIESRKDSPVFRYLEVGCAGGGTLGSIVKHLNKTVTGKWQAVGVDKREGGWQFDENLIRQFLGQFLGRRIGAGQSLDGLPYGQAFINTEGSEKFLLACKDKFDLVLIDACHSKECCTRDFEMAEKLVKPGGFVFFHDADPDCQGMDVQPHCKKPIGVRDALLQLGLLGNFCSGWEFIEDIQPHDPAVRGCVVVQKVPEP